MAKSHMVNFEESVALMSENRQSFTVTINTIHHVELQKGSYSFSAIVFSLDQTFVPKLSQSSSAVKIKESDYAQGVLSALWN